MTAGGQIGVATLIGPDAFDRLTPVKKPRAIERIGSIDVRALQQFLAGLSDDQWAYEDSRKFNKYQCFHQTTHVIPRFYQSGKTPEVYFETPLWPSVAPLMAPAFDLAQRHFGFERPRFPKVMFARLAPHGRIGTHVDYQQNNPYIHKLHVPLVTHPDVWMTVAGERAHLEVGSLYEINNCAPHSVLNESDVARVHLIFEAFDAPAN